MRNGETKSKLRPTETGEWDTGAMRTSYGFALALLGGLLGDPVCASRARAILEKTLIDDTKSICAILAQLDAAVRDARKPKSG